jgi:tetratricopeptide (TPR) repeat protein
MQKKFIILLLFSLSSYAQKNVDTLLKQGKYTDAIVCLKKQADSKSKYVSLAKIYEQIGNDSQAISYYNKALSLQNSERIAIALSKVYERNAYYRKAIALIENIVKKNKSNLLLKYRLGKLYQKTYQNNKALDVFYALREQDPKNPNYDYQIGRTLDDVNLKINTFLSAYRKDHKHIKSIIKLAHYYKLIDFKDSSAIFTRKGLKLNPYHPKLLQNEVLNLAGKSKYKAALQLLERMDSILPKNVFVAQSKGWIYLQQKKYDKAEKYLKKAIGIDKNTLSSYYYLGEAYRLQNKDKLALRVYQIGIQKAKPDLTKEYYAIASIYKRQKKYRKAIEYFSKSYNNSLKNHKALFEQANLSDIYYKNPDIALELFKKYIERFAEKDAIKTSHAQKRIAQISARKK